jgi:polyisoprenoid-binding protein YceI
VSEKIEPTGDKTFKATGQLTIKNVTKPVILDVTYQGAVKDPWGMERAAFTATTNLNRQDFGLTWNKALETGGMVVGDEVTITINVEGVKQAA